ncbi:MAG TPA: NAD(P)H-dependent oxidoreductase subunit E [Candidatus Limnocylindrales bacterium]|jgi:NADH-quinone oxidoreductase subunit E|nr:NAD(P)H-dependent oxidoreductase subunit E [Candidatus Limnocylindrales bacterium]
MKFSDQLEQRFAEMSTHYPTKRSVLVPMLLYIQDEVGCLTDEAIHEIAHRTELSDLEVRNVVSYYSMLRTHPIGKYNLQVCTNVSCLLRGGEEILEHCKKKLGVGNKQSTADGLFYLEEVECIGACSWAPAMQVNYDYHENLTNETIDELIDGIRKKEQQ